MQYAYDLDGTLVETREAVLAAYRAVGVEPPLDFFGKTWREWLDDPTLHAAKNEEYLKIIRTTDLVRATQIVSLFLITGGFIITGASRKAATAVLDHIGLRPQKFYYELSMKDKAEVLNFHNGDQGIVFEDSEKVASYLKENTSWTVCHVLS